MAVEGIDFEGNGGGTPPANANGNAAAAPDTTSLNGGSEVVDVNDPANGGATTKPAGQVDPNNNPDNPPANEGDNEPGGSDTTSSTGELEPGTEIEFEGKAYKVAENGDIVAEDGTVFVEAKNVKEWLANTTTADDAPLSIDAIRESVGIDVTDNEGKPVEFTNDADGVKSYVESVIALKSKEVAQGAVNKLFTDNPILKQFVDYLQVNGTPRGFGDIPDRSGIQLDKDNAAQLEAIIRMAAQEFGNKSISDTYIKYLRESGGLYDEAKSQLEALVGKDKAYREELKKQAEARREAQEKEITEYWQGVSDAIQKRVIGGYKIPDSFVKEVNGQKITLTPDDFYKYVAEGTVETEDGNTLTAYQRDLNKLSNEEALAKELLDAWLMFTGGTYKDLIGMAVKEDAVRKLVIKSKEQRSARTIKINKPTPSKVNLDDIVLS